MMELPEESDLGCPPDKVGADVHNVFREGISQVPEAAPTRSSKQFRDCGTSRVCVKITGSSWMSTADGLH